MGEPNWTPRLRSMRAILDSLDAAHAAAKRCWYGCPPAHGCYTASSGETWHLSPDEGGGWLALVEGHDEGCPTEWGATRDAAIEAVEELIAEEASA